PAAQDLPGLDLALLLRGEVPGQQLDRHPDGRDGEAGHAEEQGDDGGGATTSALGPQRARRPRRAPARRAAAVRPLGIHTVTVYPVALVPVTVYPGRVAPLTSARL